MNKRDRGNFDDGEGGFQKSEARHVERVERHGHGRRDEHEDPARYRRKPIAEVNTDRRHERAKRESLCEPISESRQKPCPRADIFVGIDAESPRDGMDDGHLGQHEAHRERHDRSEEVRDDDALPRQANRGAASEKQADPDDAADGNHPLLKGAELTLEPVRALARRHRKRTR